MGNTAYSAESYRNYSVETSGLSTANRFTQQSKRRVHNDMDSTKIKFREARDSKLHHNTVPIIIGLDVTGSMGYIPEKIVSEDMNKLVHNLIQSGIKDPSICFTGIGDQVSDQAPFQAGQFESGDQELVGWLTKTWLEGRGGGTAAESYILAWFFAAFMTKTDNWEKRHKKGFIFTIGDETTWDVISDTQLQKIFTNIPNKQLLKNYSAQELLKIASEKWNIFHIHANDGSYKYDGFIENNWKKLDISVIVAQNHKDIPDIINKCIIDNTLVIDDITDKQDEKPNML